MNTNVFTIDLSSEYAQWWRYNIYISVVCYDGESQVTDYINHIDKVHEIINDDKGREQPVEYPESRVVRVATTPCDHIGMYIYVIANTFPSSSVIKDSPPFEAVLTLSCNGIETEKRLCDVNQWGGFTIAGELIYSPDGQR